MTNTNDLEAALSSAFPAVTIDRAMIDEPTASWSVYDDRDDLAAFEGKTWRELPDALLERHSTLPIYAGDTLFRATLPAYLHYLLQPRRVFNDLPFQLAGQLARRTDVDNAKLDRRLAPLTAAQRAAVGAVLSRLATIPPMEHAMGRAAATWNREGERKGR